MSAEEDNSSSALQERGTATTLEELATDSQELDDDCDYLNDEALKAALMAATESVKPEELEKPEDTGKKNEDDIEVKADAMEKEEDVEDAVKTEEDSNEVNAAAESVKPEDLEEPEDTGEENEEDIEVKADAEALSMCPAISGPDAESAELDCHLQELGVDDQATEPYLTTDDLVNEAIHAYESGQQKENVQEDEEGETPTTVSLRAASGTSSVSRHLPLAAERASAAGSHADSSVKQPLRTLESINVHIARTNGRRLGVDVHAAQNSLVVLEVVEDGLIQAWNDENPQQAVWAGDRIVAVNNRKMSASKLFQAIQSPEGDLQNLLILCGGIAASSDAEAYGAGQNDARSATLRCERSNGFCGRLRGRIPAGSLQKRSPLQQPQRPPKCYWGHQQQARSRTPFDNSRSTGTSGDNAERSSKWHGKRTSRSRSHSRIGYRESPSRLRSFQRSSFGSDCSCGGSRRRRSRTPRRRQERPRRKKVRRRRRPRKNGAEDLDGHGAASAETVPESRMVHDAAAAVDRPDMLTSGETEAQTVQENAEVAAEAESEIAQISDPGRRQEMRGSTDCFAAQSKTTRDRFLVGRLEQVRKNGHALSSKSKGSCHQPVSKAPTTAALGFMPRWDAPIAPAPPLHWPGYAAQLGHWHASASTSLASPPPYGYWQYHARAQPCPQPLAHFPY